MCGIIGIHTATKAGFFKPEVDALRGLMVVNSLRGVHSTGLMGFDRNDKNNHEVNIVKGVGNPYDLFKRVRTDEFFGRVFSSFGTVVGHGRYATRGEINADNAHPFEERHITLVHNGGISNYYQLRDYQKHSDIEVDSHLIARLISEEGADAILPRLEGAYTLVWYDSTDGTLHMARNDQRPLFIAKNKNTMFFASEREALDFVNVRYDLKFETVEPLPTYKHYVFEKGSLTPSITEYKPIPVKKYVTRYNDLYEDEGGILVPSPPLTKREQRKLNRRTKQGNVTNIDKKYLESKETTVRIGDSLTVEIEDFDIFPASNYKLVKGYSEDFPNMEFCAHCSISEEVLISGKFLKGKVKSIVPINPEVSLKKVGFRVFLDDVTVIYPPESGDKSRGYIDGDEWVNLFDTTNNSMVNLATWRMKQLSKKGCGWCTVHIPEAELENPEKLGYYQDAENSVESIICSNCMCGFSDNTPIN